VGVATQDELLEKNFRGKPEYIINYFNFVAEDLREIMSALGVRSLDEMVGRTDLLELNSENLPWKAKNIDFSKILYSPSPFRTTIKDNSDKGLGPKTVGTHCQMAQDHGISNVLDLKLIKLAKDALEDARPVKEKLLIKNTDRTTGAMLSGELVKRYGEAGLADNTIHYRFYGVAGQSFGAFLAKGITFELEGMANDYVGKGISGGKIIIYPDRKSDFKSENNIIIGNTTFYGAIHGEAYIRGVAGERFCIRNSGLNAVVEGVGDHACEYMTGGRVVILGQTGVNFAAGMSGGLAYVYDEDRAFETRCNLDMVDLVLVEEEEDIKELKTLIENHWKYTSSAKAKAILDNWDESISQFVKVFPMEYRRVLGMMSAADAATEREEVFHG